MVEKVKDIDCFELCQQWITIRFFTLLNRCMICFSPLLIVRERMESIVMCSYQDRDKDLAI